MKYAVIILVALYLVIYGCSPDKTEKATESHEQTVTTAKELTPVKEPVTAQEEHQEQHQAAEAAQPTEEVEHTVTVVAEQAAEAVEHTAEAAEHAGKVVEHVTEVVEQTVEAAAKPSEEVEQPADVSEQPAEVAEQDAATAKQAPEILSVAKAEGTQPVVQEDEPQMVVMPCGRKMAMADVPPNAPCLRMQRLAPQQQEPTDREEVLAEALQNMVDATNEMILATRELVIATQDLLDADKEAAEPKAE